MADASDRRPAASATGKLAITPLAHVLVYARNKRLTGTLELHAPDERSGTLIFWRGRITRAEVSPSPCYFGAVAYEMGLIDAATLDATLLEVARERRPHGEILVGRGALTQAQRDDVLREQACRKVHHLFTLPGEAAFAFYEARPSETEPPLLLETLAPVWRGIRDFPPDDGIREVLARYAGAHLRMVNEAPLARVGLGPEEAELVALLSSQPMTLADLLSRSRLTRARVELLAYLLLIGKCVEPVSASLTNLGAAPAAPSAAPPAGSGEFRRRAPSFRVPSAPRVAASTSLPPRAAPPIQTVGPVEVGEHAILARARGLEAEGYFTALGLPEASPPEAVRAAFFRLAKLWSPARVPDELAHVSREIGEIYEHMAMAHRTLTDPELRRRYLATRKPTLRRPRAEVLRDIEAALARRDYFSAEGDARMLHEADADDATALAIIAWAGSWAGDASDEALRAALVLLDRAVQLDRYCDRAYYYRGMIQKKLGDSASAYRDFARTLQANPRHVDAEREVRLHEMRARRGGAK